MTGPDARLAAVLTALLRSWGLTGPSHPLPNYEAAWRLGQVSGITFVSADDVWVSEPGVIY